MQASQTITLRTMSEIEGVRRSSEECDAAAIVFADLVEDGYLNADFVDVLLPFVSESELPYWNAATVRDVLEVLCRQGSLLDGVLTERRLRLDHALQGILRWSTSTDHIHRVQADRPAALAVVEDDILPGYLRLVELAYGPLTEFLITVHDATANGVVRAPELNQRSLWFGMNGLSGLARGYNNLMRNSIAHGSWRFVDDKIELFDRGVEKQFSMRELLEVLHELRSTCTSMLLALVIYMGQHHKGTPELLPTIGRFLLNGTQDVLWCVERIHESVGEEPKVFLDVRIKEPSHEFVVGLIAKLGVWTDELFGQKYQLINISVDTGADSPAQAYISTSTLREELDTEMSPEVWNEVVSFLPFGVQVPSKIEQALPGRVRGLKLLKHSLVGEFKHQLREQGISFAADEYTLQLAGQDWHETGATLFAFAVLKPHTEASTGRLRKIANHAMKRLQGEKFEGYSMFYKSSRKPVAPNLIWLQVVCRPQPLWMLDHHRHVFSRNVLAAAIWQKRPSELAYFPWARAERTGNTGLLIHYSDEALPAIAARNWRWDGIYDEERLRARLVQEEIVDSSVVGTMNVKYVLSEDVDASEIEPLLQRALTRARQGEGLMWWDEPQQWNVSMGFDERELIDDDQWGWIAKATWRPGEELDADVLLHDTLAAQVDALSASPLSAPMTVTAGESVRIELEDTEPHVPVDALEPVDAAVKRLTRAQRFTVVKSGSVWLSFTREQWRRSNVNREPDSSLFAKLARGEPTTLKHAKRQLKKNGALEEDPS